MPTLWKHSNGRWYALYREDGKAKRHSLKTRKKSDAQTEYNKWLKARENPSSTSPQKAAPETLDELWALYSLWLSDNVRRSTLDARQWAWNHFISHFDSESLDRVTAGHVEAHRNMMASAWTAHTWNDFRRNMNTIYQDLARLDLYRGPNPWNQVKGRRVPRVKKQVLTTEQRDKLIQTAQEHAKHSKADRIDYVIALMALAGLRKGEAIACRWEWFDWDKKILNVFEDEGDLKTVGTVPLSNRLMDILTERQESGFLYRSETPQDGSKYRVDFRKSFNHVCTLAEMDWITPHLLRHTFGSLLLDAGVPLHKVSKWMRHSSIKVTADIYYHHQEYDNEINACA